jgi:hypothetical protein
MYDFTGPSLPSLLGFSKEWNIINTIYKKKDFKYKIRKLVKITGSENIKKALESEKIEKNRMQSFITGAGAEYGTQLNKKYNNKSVEFKSEKFKKSMDYYGINVKIKEFDTKSKTLILECNDCIFDFLESDLISFCNYSESFFRTYFNANVEKRCRDKKESCLYVIKIKS